PRVRLELAPCAAVLGEAIERAVRVELGAEDGGASDGAVGAVVAVVTVRIDCVAGGLDAGVSLDVRWPDRPNPYRYALDWRSQPPDARSRLVGLAVAEAVDASRIELTAVPPPAPARRPRGATWALGIARTQRSFDADRGVEVVGAGVSVARRARRLHLACDLVLENTNLFVSSGHLDIETVSVAPRAGIGFGARAHVELGVAARLGVARMASQVIANGYAHGTRATRMWGGPAATAGIGVAIAPRFSVDLQVEAGRAVIGFAARDFNGPAARLDGWWTSLGLAAVVAL
ncbi:MAG: hypothetical protein KIT31_28380, partial [Deltaproteobacteria bacterium]|nr:hypothetical protein [Deltaproteobacteria bacterium]